MISKVFLRSVIASIVSTLFFIGVVSVPLTPLSFFYLGLRYGLQQASVAVGVFFILSMALFGLPIAIASAIIFGLPSLFLTRMSLLSRQNDPSAPDDHEFYPASRLLLWTLALSLILTLGLFGLFIDQSGGLPGVMLTVFTQSPEMITILGNSDFLSISDAALSLMLNTIIISSSASWILSIFGSLLLAQKLCQNSGQNLRSPFTLKSMHFGDWLLLALLISGAGVYFTSGAWSVFFATIAASFIIPYFLLGLVIIHAISWPRSGRMLILVSVYVVLLAYVWFIIPVAILGILNPQFKILEKIEERREKKDNVNRRDPPNTPPEE